jgi:hypothetical protein
LNQNILLVQPKFPTPSKSLNHKDFLPIPLLKIASYHKTLNDAPHLVHGKVNTDFEPDLIYITSLFTYWQKEFWDTTEYYRTLFPNTPINVGGIYVSLFFENSEFQEKCAKLNVTANKGTVEKFEKSAPDYSFVDVDYQIIHASRGCKRHCTFCGVWKIEPEFKPKKSIKNEVLKNKVVFYDNNLLANPFIENILKELIDLKVNGKVVKSESQSGLDGRLLTLKLAKLLKKARFINPRIAWDGPFKEWKKVDKQIKILSKAGYNRKDISIFMIFNWEHNFEEMELKRKKCYEWGVQIADCRNRPLHQEFDNYNGRIKQTNKDYYIHKIQGWTDSKVKKFRKNIRRQNICIRNGYDFHSSKLERKVIPKSDYHTITSMPSLEIKKILPDAWWPDF